MPFTEYSVWIYGELNAPRFLTFYVRHVKCIVHVVTLMAYNQAKYLITLYIFSVTIQYLVNQLIVFNSEITHGYI